MPNVLLTSSVPGWSEAWEAGDVITVNDATAQALIDAGLGTLTSQPATTTELLTSLVATIDNRGHLLISSPGAVPIDAGYVVGPPAAFVTVEITKDTALTAEAHNGKQLVISVPVTLTAAFSDLGDGFSCTLQNQSGGNVVMGGLPNANGATRLANGATGFVNAFAYSGGSAIVWGGNYTL
jgi:hypothetical protein